MFNLTKRNLGLQKLFILRISLHQRCAATENIDKEILSCNLV